MLSLFEWLEERLENCLRISSMKHGADKDGWLEDARYFRAAHAAISDINLLRAKNAELRADNEALREDAERYRWLRDDHRGRTLSMSAIEWSGDVLAADAAIDAERKQ
jgi:hypothetical protein